MAVQPIVISVFFKFAGSQTVLRHHLSDGDSNRVASFEVKFRDCWKAEALHTLFFTFCHFDHGKAAQSRTSEEQNGRSGNDYHPTGR